MNFGGWGALLLAVAVTLGAFGAHALRAKLDAYSIGIWEKAVFYHFVHAFGVLIVGLAGRSGVLPPAATARVSILLMAGILLFSGSLYALALSGVKVLGAVTPVGGLCLIAAWLLLAFELRK